MSRPSTSAESDVYDDGRSEAKDAEQGANDKANVERLDHTTSIAMRPGSVILPPEPAKPSPCRSTAPTTPPPSSSPPASSPTSSPLDPPMATSIPMPGLANLILHSPSATIVGTPFALDTDIQRFEYPFPDTSLALPGLYEYNNTSSGSSGSGGSASARLGVPPLSHSSSSGSSGSSSSASTSCTSSAAPSPSHPPSQTHQHHDPHHPQHQLQQHPQHSQHTHQHVHIVSRHATHPIHIAHIAHPHAIPNHPLSQSPPGSAFPLALTSSLTSAKSSHPSHHHHTHSHQHSHSNSHNSNTHPGQHSQHPLSPNASALLADSDREEPPVPPGLLKKHRWSLGLLSTPQRTSTGTQREGAGRQRRSATADHARRGDQTAHTNDVNDGAAEYFDVSPGSCTSESSSCSAASDALHALHISDSDTLQGSDTEPPSKLGEEGEDSVVVEAVDLTARSALVG